MHNVKKGGLIMKISKIKKDSAKIGLARDKGFSLIDVLIALLILGFILLSIAQIIALALYNENKARHQTTLLFFGQQQMEVLLSLPIGAGTTHPSLSPYEVTSALQTGEGCSQISDRNIYCFNYDNFDNNHKYPATKPSYGTSARYYYMVWSVTLLDAAFPNGARVITLYVIPYPPPQGGYKSPVMLRGIAYP
jgi:type II secretory pathway pseudopilin PulG